MAREKQRGLKLPANPIALLNAIGFAEEKSTAGFRLSLLIDSSLDHELVRYAKERFYPVTDNLSISVIPYFDELPKFALHSELVIIFAAEAPLTGRLLIQALKEQVPAVVVTLDPMLLQRIARDNYQEIDLPSLVTVPERGDTRERFERLFKELGEWITRASVDGLLPLARALPFVRDPFVKNAIQAAALQNAAIAAVFFLPGADMPLLTLNQARLFLQIAAVYDAELDRQRIKEMALIVLGGFGFRMIARRLALLLPTIKWALRGSVAYTGTLAVGMAAREYFEKGGDLKDIVKGLQTAAKPKAL